MASLTLSYSSSSPYRRPCLLRTTTTHLRHSSLSFPIKTPIQISITINSAHTPRFPCCSAAKQQSGSSVKKRRTTPTPPKKKEKRGSSKTTVEVTTDNDDEFADSFTRFQSYQPASMPKPPAGFVLDDNGKVVMVSSKRMVTIVDTTDNTPLECIIRRVFTTSRGDDCLLLCPVDMPVQVLRSTNVEGWSPVSDEEVENILPATAYALAKIHMHFIQSGFCYTARGGFCYSEEDIIEFAPDNDQDLDGLPNEAVRITSFHQDGTHYMIYTPSDPLLFVAVKDADGNLRIAEDDLLEDPAVVDAIDEETEFNALMEEETALLDSLFEEDE